MSDNSHSEVSTELFGGRLEGISLPDLLWALHRARKTGVLTIRCDWRTKSLYLEEGRIVFASSDDPNDRLGELFLRQGLLGIEQLDQALSRLHTGKRLGALLVEDGSLAPETLVQGVLGQVRMIVLDVFGWDEGEYHFAEGLLPTDEVITLNMKTGEILLQGMRRIQSFARIRRSVGPLTRVYGLTPEGRDSLADVGLTEGEELLLVRLEQGDETVEALCREVFLSNFEIYQTLWALRVIGAVEPRELRVEQSSGSAQAGQLAQMSFAEVLIEACRSAADGVLFVSRHSRERSFHIRNGRCVFATSNSPDDGLVSYLLRRGVISLRDREETAKRVLSNKRVGTILLELGVIDETDLQEMVRQHLKEIVYDTFLWDSGDFAFVPGELPSVEEIVLDPTLEALVADGLRRVYSWQRIVVGCGGLDQPLGLTPSYLDVLDGMRAGPDEWRLINALKHPKSAKELSRELAGSDFSICQTLWTLRVLGALEPAERVETVDEVPAAESEADPESTAQMVAVVDAAIGSADLSEPGPYGESDAAGGEPKDSAVEVPIHDESASFEEESTPARDESASFEEESTPARDEAASFEEESTPARDEAASFEEESTPARDEAARFHDDEEDVDGPVEASGEQRSDRYDAPQRIEIVDEDDHEEHEPDLPPPPDEAWSADQTQVISADLIAEALQTPDDDETGPPQPQVDEEDEFDRTTRLPREEVEAALAGEASEDDTQEVYVEETDGWEPPSDLDAAIARFNAAQRVVFRAVRTEVGAGAANFIRTCCGPGDASPDPILEAELLPDGTWDVAGLRRAAVRQRIEDPWNVYRLLIDQELEQLRGYIGEASVIELEHRIADVTHSASAD